MSKSPLPYLLFAAILAVAAWADIGPSDVQAEQATADAAQDAITQAQADAAAERVARLAPGALQD